MSWLEVLILLVILGVNGAVLLVPIGAVVLIMKVLKSGESGKGKQASAEEARLIQEIHNGLTKMESRIEALETLLVDLEKGKEKES